jgi:flagellar basal-body rod modification protein FlgD
MQVDNVSAAALAVAPRSTTGSSGTSGSQAVSLLGGNNSNLFITLLTTQLQAQDPLNPVSPQDMVTQLTQVSSLQELVSIHQTLQTMAGGPGSSVPNTNPTS